MHVGHVAEDIRKLTIHPVVISVHLLMKTNQKFSVSHHTSLSCILHGGMSSGLIGHSRLRMTDISTEGICWENFFIADAFAFCVRSNCVLKHFNWRKISPVICMIRLEI